MNSKIFSADISIWTNKYDVRVIVPQQMQRIGGSQQIRPIRGGSTAFLEVPDCNQCIQRCLPTCIGINCDSYCEEQCRSIGKCR